MRHGGVLPQVDIVYETWGRISPAKDNVVLLVTELVAHERLRLGRVRGHQVRAGAQR